MVALWIADEETRSLKVGAVNQESPDNHLPLVTLAYGQGGVGWVAAERTPLEVDDLLADSRFVGRDWWRSHGLSSFLGLPVLRDDRLFGVLALNGSQPLRLSGGAREQLTRLVNQAAHALHGAQLEVEAARQQAELVASRAAVTARLRESAGLLAIAQVVGTTADLTRALRLICRQLGVLTGADSGGLPARSLASLGAAGRWLSRAPVAARRAGDVVGDD
jgi:GAF domain-containing protein